MSTEAPWRGMSESAESTFRSTAGACSTLSSERLSDRGA